MATNPPRHMSFVPVFPVARNSTVDLIAMELRKAIFSGALPVGSAVREIEISAQLGVSRGPFREAAQRLVQEGIFRSIPGRGLRVLTLDNREIEDVYRARLAVESEAIHLLCSAKNAEHLEQLHQAFLSYEQLSQGNDAWAIGDADLAFHQLLVDLAESTRLSRLMTTLVIETRIASLSVADGFAVRSTVSATYGQLLQALSTGDPISGVHALRKQFTEAVARLTGQDTSIPTLESDINDHHTFQPISTEIGE